MTKPCQNSVEGMPTPHFDPGHVFTHPCIAVDKYGALWVINTETGEIRQAVQLWPKKGSGVSSGEKVATKGE